MVPSAATAMQGTNDCRFAGGMLSGVWFTRMGADQLKPPSEDIEKATSLYWKLPNRPSLQTAQMFPLRLSMATDWLSELLTSWPVSGSVTNTSPSALRIGSMTGPGVGADQVWPWSVDRMTCRVAVCWMP